MKTGIASPPGFGRLLLVYLAVRVVMTLLVLLNGRLPYGDSARAWKVSESGFRYRVIDDRFLDSLDRNDSRGYLWIASYGYAAGEDRQLNTAFFPGYALVVRAAHDGLRALWPGGAPPPASREDVLLWHHAGHLVSVVAFLCFLLAFHFWCRRRFDPEVAWRAGLLVILSPMGFLFSCIMSEALFLMTAFLALVMAEQGRYLKAGLAGAAAAATKSFGGAVLVSLMLIQWERAKWSLRGWGYGWLAFLLVPLALLGVMLWMAELSGSFFHYVDQQAYFFGHSHFPNFASVLDLFDPRGKTVHHLVRDVFQILGLGAALLGMAVFLRRRPAVPFRWAHVALPVIVLCVTLLAGAAVSMARYAALSAPAYVGWALLLDHPRRFRIALAASALLQAALWLSWMNSWRWVV